MLLLLLLCCCCGCVYILLISLYTTVDAGGFYPHKYSLSSVSDADLSLSPSLFMVYVRYLSLILSVSIRAWVDIFMFRHKIFGALTEKSCMLTTTKHIFPHKTVETGSSSSSGSTSFIPKNGTHQKFVICV